MKPKHVDPKAFHTQKLESKALAEGYCCIFGYLRLCKARNERVKDMAKFINMGPNVIWRHYRLLKAGEHMCKTRSDCLNGVIQTIEAENAAAQKSD